MKNLLIFQMAMILVLERKPVLQKIFWLPLVPNSCSGVKSEIMAIFNFLGFSHQQGPSYELSKESLEEAFFQVWSLEIFLVPSWNPGWYYTGVNIYYLYSNVHKICTPGDTKILSLGFWPRAVLPLRGQATLVNSSLKTLQLQGQQTISWLSNFKEIHLELLNNVAVQVKVGECEVYTSPHWNNLTGRTVPHQVKVLQEIFQKLCSFRCCWFAEDSRQPLNEILLSGISF